MVNVSQYQIGATGNTVAECESNYRVMLARNNLISADDTEVQPSDQQEVTGVIAEIRSAVIEGNTWYYLRLEQGDVYYAVSSADQRSAALLSVGDTVRVQYMAGEETILDTYAVSLVPKT